MRHFITRFIIAAGVIALASSAQAARTRTQGDLVEVEDVLNACAASVRANTVVDYRDSQSFLRRRHFIDIAAREIGVHASNIISIEATKLGFPYEFEAPKDFYNVVSDDRDWTVVDGNYVQDVFYFDVTVRQQGRETVHTVRMSSGRLPVFVKPETVKTGQARYGLQPGTTCHLQMKEGQTVSVRP